MKKLPYYESKKCDGKPEFEFQEPDVSTIQKLETPQNAQTSCKIFRKAVHRGCVNFK